MAGAYRVAGDRDRATLGSEVDRRGTLSRNRRADQWLTGLSNDAKKPVRAVVLAALEQAAAGHKLPAGNRGPRAGW
jgi:hypothetical protein